MNLENNERVSFSRNGRPCVFIGKQKIWLQHLDKLKNKLLEHAIIKDGEPYIQVNKLPNNLKQNLKAWSYALEGKKSAGPTINKLNFQTRKQQAPSIEYVRKVFREALPKSEVEDILINPRSVSLQKRMSEVDRGITVMQYVYSKRNPLSLQKILDSLYPDLTKEFGSLYHTIRVPKKLTQEHVVSWLDNHFFAGRSLSANALRKLPYGERYLDYIMNNAIPGKQIEMFFSNDKPTGIMLPKRIMTSLRRTYNSQGTLKLKENKKITPIKVETIEIIIKKLNLPLSQFSNYYKLKKDFGSTKKYFSKEFIKEHEDEFREIYNQSMTLLLGRIPDLLNGATRLSKTNNAILSYLKVKHPSIKPSDVFNYRLANGLVGKAAQGEVALAFALASKYGNKTIDDLLQPYFGSKIKSIEINDYSPGIAIKKGEDLIIPDLRLTTEEEKHFIVEVKRYTRFLSRDLETMIKKYDNIKTCLDGTKIDGKINVQVSPHTLREEQKQELYKNGWSVIDGVTFNNLYLNHILPTFISQYNGEFNYTEIPLAGDFLEVDEKLRRVANWLEYKPSQLAKPTHKFRRQWLSDFFNKAAISIMEGKKFEEGREEYAKLKKEYVIPLEQFQDLYAVKLRIDFSEKRNYFDHETLSFLHQGGMIPVTCSLLKEEKGNFVHAYLARDPLEEKDLLENSARNSNGRVLTGFSSDSFDWHYTIESAYANNIPFDELRPHLDLLVDWRPIAQKHKFPHPKNPKKIWIGVQAFEQYFLHSKDARENDIPGSEIPEAAKNFYYTGVTDQIKDVITHCCVDVITTSQLDIMLEEGETTFLAKQEFVKPTFLVPLLDVNKYNKE